MGVGVEGMDEKEGKMDGRERKARGRDGGKGKGMVKDLGPLQYL
jgi:hypothetical protein